MRRFNAKEEEFEKQGRANGRRILLPELLVTR